MLLYLSSTLTLVDINIDYSHIPGVTPLSGYGGRGRSAQKGSFLGIEKSSE